VPEPLAFLSRLAGWRSWLLQTFLLAAAAAGTGRFAQILWPQAWVATAVATGLSLAVLLRGRRSLWPGTALSLAVLFGAQSSWPTAALHGLWCTGVIWLAATLLQWARLDRSLPHARDALLLAVGCASAAVALQVPAAWSSTSLFSLQPLLALPAVALTIFVVALPALAADRHTVAIVGPDGRWRACAALLLATAAATALALALPQSPLAGATLLFGVPLLLCALTFVRALSLSATLALCVAAAVAAASARGLGPFHALGPVHLWAFMAALAALPVVAASLTGDLARRHDRWRLALEASDLGVAEWHPETGRGTVSRRWHLLVDDRERGAPMLADWLARVHDDDLPHVQEALDALRHGKLQSFRRDIRLAARAGWRWFDCRAVVARRDAPASMRLVMTLADITERHGAEERQRLSASLFQHLHEGLLITDAELRVLDVNPTYSQITGLARQEVLGEVPALLQPTAADPSARVQQAAMWASLRATGTWRGEVVERRRNGDPCALHVTITAVRGPDAQAHYHVLVISDITEQRLQRERLERQAHFDELTRLPNRMHMSQLLADAMAAAQREGCLLAVCYVDLDHFKPVNDRYGHAAGDRLLVELAQRLRGALRSSGNWSDVAARLGGDEFVLLLRAGTVEEARLAVERVLRVIAMPYVIEPGADMVHVTASVGATLYPQDRSDPDTLLRHADHAMYGAKQSGRNGYLFFDPEHSRRTEERVMAIGRVQDALDNRELVLHYQPKVDMRRGVVLGVEALLRWNHPEHGVVPPLQFLPLIEHTGLSARVGDWVLEQALDQLAHWQRMGLDISVSVNVSARHLQEPDFAQRVAELLARHTRPLGARLELEVLETAALADVAYTSQLMERCRSLGLHFALDDFGTGYSTLTYLKQLPVDVLKIDRSFVHNMLDDRQDLAIVEGVIGLARTFGCGVIAEGVESPAQARLLIEMGCDVGQGQGIASPMPATEVFRWVRDYRGPFALTAAPTGPALDTDTPAAQALGPE
jgi:diguanylate cyclase (GGDEF)-like protein/PAS domain S-box-containing protein